MQHVGNHKHRNQNSQLPNETLRSDIFRLLGVNLLDGGFLGGNLLDSGGSSFLVGNLLDGEGRFFMAGITGINLQHAVLDIFV